MDNQPKAHNSAGASAYLEDNYGLRFSEHDLLYMRKLDQGPAWQRVGRSIIYLEPSLDAWAKNELDKGQS